ncbi:hypothetical protein Tco_1251173 [Tanacetum coccineum]
MHLRGGLEPQRLEVHGHVQRPLMLMGEVKLRVLLKFSDIGSVGQVPASRSDLGSAGQIEGFEVQWSEIQSAPLLHTSDISYQSLI